MYKVVQVAAERVKAVELLCTAEQQRACKAEAAVETALDRLTTALDVVGAATVFCTVVVSHSAVAVGYCGRDSSLGSSTALFSISVQSSTCRDGEGPMALHALCRVAGGRTAG